MRVSVPMSLPPSSYYLLHASYTCIYIYLHTYLYTWVDVLIPTSNCQVCSVYSYSYLLVCLLACLSNLYIYTYAYIYIHTAIYLYLYTTATGLALQSLHLYTYIHICGLACKCLSLRVTGLAILSLHVYTYIHTCGLVAHVSPSLPRVYISMVIHRQQARRLDEGTLTHLPVANLAIHKHPSDVSPLLSTEQTKSTPT